MKDTMGSTVICPGSGDVLTMLIGLETNLLNNLGKVVTVKSGSEVRGTG